MTSGVDTSGSSTDELPDGINSPSPGTAAAMESFIEHDDYTTGTAIVDDFFFLSFIYIVMVSTELNLFKVESSCTFIPIYFATSCWTFISTLADYIASLYRFSKTQRNEQFSSQLYHQHDKQNHCQVSPNIFVFSVTWNLFVQCKWFNFFVIPNCNSWFSCPQTPNQHNGIDTNISAFKYCRQEVHC